MRKNQKNYKEQPYILRKSRKRIETLFSQLCDQFMIRRNYAKSFLGFKTRILSKINTIRKLSFFKNRLQNFALTVKNFQICLQTQVCHLISDFRIHE
ncbi:hypothetical protein BC749_11720 [Flavobacterium araucananum]|nr:hypothetical protein BC749_11720 [Flavobacterium araucananum]